MADDGFRAMIILLVLLLTVNIKSAKIPDNDCIECSIRIPTAHIENLNCKLYLGTKTMLQGIGSQHAIQNAPGVTTQEIRCPTINSTTVNLIALLHDMLSCIHIRLFFKVH